ncbi:AEC family transporter [Pseudobacteriovorax antillogorgiicola]|uniref:Predicted permease n=1 Tax=Pseudobacteriovorax antillogorgiicola TaxID=1513793 RepID=A0A1Y6CFA6_9BACT|nr:AEC family transporter [Pseudobacteriovorax antillogorgiicola]TCS51696.1 putative permease [Pseudobacteriovorax antillogorgiicola]SMF49159.1 Predicted permease [Pseudobacteriovorax antillogorgiicola]
MQNIISVVDEYQGLVAYLCTVGLGFFLQKSSLITPALTLFLSKSLVRFLFPCLIFSSIIQQYSRNSLLQSWHLPFGAMAILTLGLVLGMPLRRFWTTFPVKDQHTFQFMTIMPNYIFLPLPICQALWGEEAVAVLVFSSLGSEVMLWLIAVPLLGGQRGKIRNLLTPPMFALGASLGLVLAGKPQSAQALMDLAPVMTQIGQACVPVSLFLLGCHFGRTTLPLSQGSHWTIAAFRLLLIPLVSIVLLRLSSLPILHQQVLFLVSTMPPAVASVIMSEIYNGNPRLAAEQVMFAHLLSVLTITFWLYYGLNFLS